MLVECADQERVGPEPRQCPFDGVMVGGDAGQAMTGMDVGQHRQGSAAGLDLAHEVVEHITMDPEIAIVAVVGENMRGTPGVAGRTFHALGREAVNIIAIAQGSSETNISFVVSDKCVKQALLATHREFALGTATA